MTDTKQKILEKFNTELGSDLKRQNKIYEFHQRLIAQKNEIEKSLSMASTEAPSKVKAVIESVEKINTEFQRLEQTSVEFRSNVQETIHENEKSLK